MSQQKVDYHKEQKRNRRQIMRKEKAMRRLEITALIVILAALVGWFSYLVYRNIQSKYAAANVNVTEMHLAGWDSYMGELDTLINGGEAEDDSIIETVVDGDVDVTAEEAEEELVMTTSAEEAEEASIAASAGETEEEIAATSAEAAEEEAAATSAEAAEEEVAAASAEETEEAVSGTSSEKTEVKSESTAKK